MAGVIPAGIYYSGDPTDASAWTDLTAQPGSNLPAVVAGTPAQPNGNFDAIRLRVCQQTSRVYAWFFNTVCDASGGNCHEQTASLYTAATPTSAWSEITMTSPPEPSYGLYGSLFSVAPNSPGDGQNDVLFFGAIDPHRRSDRVADRARWRRRRAHRLHKLGGRAELRSRQTVQRDLPVRQRRLDRRARLHRLSGYGHQRRRQRSAVARDLQRGRGRRRRPPGSGWGQGVVPHRRGLLYVYGDRQGRVRPGDCPRHAPAGAAGRRTRLADGRPRTHGHGAVGSP
jgi:hypothetical protein